MLYTVNDKVSDLKQRSCWLFYCKLTWNLVYSRPVYNLTLQNPQLLSKYTFGSLGRNLHTSLYMLCPFPRTEEGQRSSLPTREWHKKMLFVSKVLIPSHVSHVTLAGRSPSLTVNFCHNWHLTKEIILWAVLMRSAKRSRTIMKSTYLKIHSFTCIREHHFTWEG